MDSTPKPPIDIGEAATMVSEGATRPDAGGGPQFAEAQMLGRYAVLGTLGRGGMGTVLEAFDRSLGRHVALKVLHRELDDQHTLRLRREAQAMAKLSHPNVVQVYEVGEVDGQTFVAMELVQGMTAKAWVEQDPRPDWRACVQMYIKLGAGLVAAHESGLIHRDFKPSNAILDDKGRPRVLDFGLARQVDEADEAPSPPSPAPEDLDESGPLSQSLTRTGAVLGTPAYMPLEQMKGQEADARSDQFSYCVALYEAVYGERPFQGRSLAALMISMSSGENSIAKGVRTSTSTGTRVPAALRRILQRGLATEPAERWPSMEALLTELRRVVAPRRRAAWLTAAVVAGLGLVGLGIAYQAQMGQRCEGAEQQLVGAWDDARKDEVRGAIVGTKLSYAAQTWTRVEQGLDDYAKAWTHKHTEVCEATSVRQEQSTEVMDLRMECLRRRRGALREVVEVLTVTDETRAEKAVDLVAGLPRLSRCDDVAALRAELPPPEDPDDAAAVEEQRGTIQRIDFLLDAGAYDEAQRESQAVVERAEDLRYPPLVAEALLRRASVREKQGEYDGAVEDLERAFSVGTQNGHDRAAAIAASHLTLLVGVRQLRLEQGLWWGKVSLPLARGISTDPLLEANALNDLGTVLHTKRESLRALEHFRRALEIREAILGGDHPNVAHAENNIGESLRVQGKLEEALPHYQRSLAIEERVFGPDHPQVAGSLNNIGETLRQQGKLDEALDHYQRSREIRQRALGPDHPLVADSLNNIGIVRRHQGRRDEALETYRRVLAIREKALGPNHRRIASVLNNIGTVLDEQGQYEEALTYYRRTLAIMTETFGPDHPHVGGILGNIGIVLRSQGKLDESLDHMRRSLAIQERVESPNLLRIAVALKNIGAVLESQGKLVEAQEHTERALAIRERELGPKHPGVVKVLNNLGHLLDLQGKPAEAAAHYRRAAALAPEAVGADHPALATALIGLTTTARATQDLDAARAHAERAAAIRGTHEDSPRLLGQARYELARLLWSDPVERARARSLAEQAKEAFVDEADALAEIEQWLREHPAP
ncbi:MAG: serine/threonine-protein kinase [Myxococcota bacterium]